MILVSSCLIGKQCRYDGDDNYNQEVINYIGDRPFIDVCPEQLGGLSTPREPAEICNGNVLTINGIDVTSEFELGANIALNMALVNNCTEAIMKAKSPSCGVKKIYDGTHSGTLIDGDGITVQLLKLAGINVISEKDLKR